MAELKEFPLKVGRMDTEGINNAVDALITDEKLRGSAVELLRKNPHLLIRRMISLNPYQRGALKEMSEKELADLLAPVVKALESDKYTAFRVRVREDVVTQSPLRIRCIIEIDY
jgi:hypothetical protein